MNVAESETNHEEDNGDLDYNDGRIKTRAFFNTDRQDGCNHHSDDEGRQVHAELHPKDVGSSEQVVSAVYQFRRLRSDDVGNFIQESLRTRDQRRVSGLRHLAGDDVLGRAQSSPVIVGQPERHTDMEDFQQLDKVV